MTSFRRVAFPLGLVAICGGALLFSLSTAKGQPSANSSSNNSASGSPMSGMSGAPTSGMSGAPAAVSPAGAGGTVGQSATGSPTFPQTIGVSPVQIRKKNFLVLGGTGLENNYDLQNENVYALLREEGTPIPNVLHPLSTAKPSFILEHLIVYSLTGGNNSSNTGGGAASSGSPERGAPTLSGGESGAGGTQTAQGPSDAEKTVSAVRRVVEAELSRGTGRIGGAHRQKLQLLARAIRYLESANTVGSAVADAINGAGAGRPGETGGTAGTTDPDAPDPRELFYGKARLTSRQADLYTPNIP